ncbi:Ribosome biogenesis regulatory protein [Blattella germanica]|nr:Ribosome biogenesis regulatory protein [Blattella germanica]
MDIVSQVLEKAAKAAENFKPIHVDKHLDLEYDIGTLLTIDSNDLNLKKLRSEQTRDDYLTVLARENTQFLLNKIWELPSEHLEEAIIVKLPEPTFILPREKPIPKPKAPTKWEKYANEKGIQKTKKSKLTWDETLQKWIPRYGFKRASAEKQKNWLLPVPDQANPNEDQFSKLSELRTENVAKNELQRLRNLAKAKKIKIPRVGFTSTDKMSTKQLGKAVSVAKVSTASLGKFQAALPKEKRAKQVGPFMPSGKKRKLSHLMSSNHERQTNLNLLDKVLKKRPKLDMEKAVNRALHVEQEERSDEKKRTKSGKKLAGSGGKKKPKGGKGNRRPREKVGRKRR